MIHPMELLQDSIIVSDRLQGLFDFELRNHFTHVFVTDGECVMKYSGEEVRTVRGFSKCHACLKKSASPHPLTRCSPWRMSIRH